MARPGYLDYIRITNQAAVAQGRETRAQADQMIKNQIPGLIYHDYESENYISATGLIPSFGQAKAYYENLSNVDPILGSVYQSATPVQAVTSDIVNRTADSRTSTPADNKYPKTTNRLFLYGFLAAGALILVSSLKKR